jgi:zinc/manganese transport system substrate-binding protein
MNHRILLLAAATAIVLAAGLAAPGTAAAKVRVVASTTDLASIAASVGGGDVEIAVIARANTDPHRVEVLPSYMVRVARAQLYLKVGLSLDQWADQIVDGSRNDKLVVLDCSQRVEPLEKPTTRVDARQGDVHPNGNPHYWLDPHNGGLVARDIADALGRLDPAHAPDFLARAEAFAQECEAQRSAAAARIAGLQVRAILTYHASWVYLAQATGLEIAGHVEPVPGIPPTGGHLQDLVELIKRRQLGVLLQEPYFSDDAPAFLARATGIRVVKISPSCDDATAGSYLAHFKALIDAVMGA